MGDADHGQAPHITGKGAFARALWWNALHLNWILPIASIYVYAFVI